jgi:hypothetical protein
MMKALGEAEVGCRAAIRQLSERGGLKDHNGAA